MCWATPVSTGSSELQSYLLHLIRLGIPSLIPRLIPSIYFYLRELEYLKGVCRDILMRNNCTADQELKFSCSLSTKQQKTLIRLPPGLKIESTWIRLNFVFFFGLTNWRTSARRAKQIRESCERHLKWELTHNLFLLIMVQMWTFDAARVSMAMWITSALLLVAWLSLARLTRCPGITRIHTPPLIISPQIPQDD